ncbi:MAG: class I SAM-dependent methyltransferase [Candidatus Azambacteria bacterium]|nr:class I SAM-dependent methyltransferase [Candidatus Azambacteria bacterium]
MNDYFSKEYSDSGRWVSYWHQIKEVLELSPKNVLVVGKGNGLVSEYLKSTGIEAVTLDINETLRPDIAASVLKIPFAGEKFDTVLCAQVLEHLPYDDFGRALSEIKRVAKSGAVISLPHFGPSIRFLLKIPFLPELRFILKLPYPIKHQFKGEHYWEIGKRGYPTRKIKKDIINSGLIIEKDFIVFENPLHHFFILKK